MSLADSSDVDLESVETELGQRGIIRLGIVTENGTEEKLSKCLTSNFIRYVCSDSLENGLSENGCSGWDFVDSFAAPEEMSDHPSAFRQQSCSIRHDDGDGIERFDDL